jgi:holin-like protein
MLIGFTVIILFQLAGELIRTLTALPIPGPVIGMTLLLAALLFTGRLPDELDRAACGILTYLPLLFVPAGVGVMAHADLIKAEWLAITAAVVVSSILAMIVTVLTTSAVEWIQQALRARIPDAYSAQLEPEE